MKDNSFLDPYALSTKRTRLQTYVDQIDHDFVLSIRPNKGTIQVINNTLWFRFIKAIQKYGITDNTKRQQLEQFVNSFVIGVPEGYKVSRSTSSRDKRKTSQH